MTRAIYTFVTRHRRIVVHVRVLPTTHAVTKEWRGTAGTAITSGMRHIHAFTVNPPRARYSYMALAGNGNLDELVPHEVFHVVKHHLGGVITNDNEEECATAVGILSAKIIKKVRQHVETV